MDRVHQGIEFEFQSLEILYERRVPLNQERMVDFCEFSCSMEVNNNSKCYISDKL